jgi:hypothetical protein
MTTSPTIIALRADPQKDADAVLRSVVEQLLATGHVVHGHLQRQLDGKDVPCNVELECVNTARRYSISQDLGKHSVSCRMDVAEVDKLAESLADSLNAQTNYLVINRFGKREAVGQGFCCALERAVELSIPVLTVVQLGWHQELLDYASPWVQIVDPCKETVLKAVG